MRRQCADALALRNRSPSFHSGKYERLRHSRQCVFFFQRRRRTAEAAHTRADFILHARCVKPVHLLAYSAVYARIARMQPYYALPGERRRYHQIHDLIKMKTRAVVYFAPIFSVIEQRGIYKRPRIYYHVGRLKQLQASDCYKVRRPASCAYEPYFYFIIHIYKLHY